MTHSIITTDQANLDLPAIVDDLNRLLRLRTTPIGMKMFKTRAEMEASSSAKAADTVKQPVLVTLIVGGLDVSGTPASLAAVIRELQHGKVAA